MDRDRDDGLDVVLWTAIATAVILAVILKDLLHLPSNISGVGGLVTGCLTLILLRVFRGRKKKSGNG